MRRPNEVDFWRGFALVTIFINHVPGLFYERFTSRNVSISDSAELFVFLAGWSLRYVVGPDSAKVPATSLVFRLLGRAAQIYTAQILITMIALAVIAGAAIWLEQPFLLDWHNAGPVFQDAAETHVGLVLLSHQLGYFNILPLYVVLMAVAPAFAILDRISPWLLFGLSGILWATTLALGFNLPTWPVEGRWFFDPFAWQFIFVLGFLMARTDAGPGALARRWRAVLRIAAAPVVVAGAIAAWLVWSPTPASVPSPKLFFMFDKTYLSPARLIQFLSVAAVFGGLWARLPDWFAPVNAYLSMLGRHSLNVFCVASVLSLAAQIGRYVYGGGIAADTVVLWIGLAVMGYSAWISEWRERSPARSSSRA
ncbi:MAG: OpgC domain-containing protein [Hyphomicrobiales bacterium]|nr:OpgC domain-containing protein [Hyphomicrobiales bacterium]